MDICGVNKVLKLFRGGNHPNFITLHIRSLGRLENVLNEEQLTLAYEIWNCMMKKTDKMLLQKFKAEEIQGQFMFVGNISEHHDLFNSYRNDMIRPRILAQISTGTGQTPTVSGTTQQTSPFDVISYQIYAWFSVFMGFVLFFVLYALFNINIQKDTLLYAKFLTNEGPVRG